MTPMALLMIVLGTGQAAGSEPQAAAPVSDPKFLAIVEANSKGYEECMAKVDKTYPLHVTRPRPSPRSVAEAKRNLDEAMKAADDLLKRFDDEKKCRSDLSADVLPKLQAAGSTPPAATRAMDDWLAARDKSRPPAKTQR